MVNARNEQRLQEQQRHPRVEALLRFGVWQFPLVTELPLRGRQGELVILKDGSTYDFRVWDRETGAWEELEGAEGSNPGGGEGEQNVQADWDESTTGNDAYIQNKPDIPASFGDLSGSVTDSQIPSGIARDTELFSGSYDDLSDKPDIPSTTGLQNATQVQALIDDAVTDLLDGAPGALDTLNELAAALGDDASYAASITTALAAKASTATLTAHEDDEDAHHTPGTAAEDTAQVSENTRVVEHLLDRLAAIDQRVSDIDQTSVESTQAFVTSPSTDGMKLATSHPTDADRTTFSYSATLTNLTIGPNEVSYMIFRIGIDERPNLYEPQLRDSDDDTLIQNLSTLGFATELSETASYRYFWLPLRFPVEDTGTLRLRKTTRTAHHDWLGTVGVVQKYRYELVGDGIPQFSPAWTFDDDDLLIVGAMAHTASEPRGFTTIQARFGDLTTNAADARENALLVASTIDVDGHNTEIYIFRDNFGRLYWQPRFTTEEGTNYIYVTKIGGAYSYDGEAFS